ncbi:MAG TPA: hypothetical protein VNO33_13325, partial [Kofleriaceae bacterium]|nr:hypothetical protein [Kofleriaceae bacterium]
MARYGDATVRPGRTGARERRSILVGSLWMVFLSLALFFVPALNGLIAGLVGGYKVGSIGRALVAAILPAIVVAGGLWAGFALFDAPVWGLLAGTAIGVLILLADLGLLIGAAIGGAIGSRPR